MQEVNKLEIGNRIREFREATAETQSDLAKLLNVKRQIVSYYESGTRVPNLEHLVLIAGHYKTTTDYLLGLSDTPTTNKDLQYICDYTGLSDESVTALHGIKCFRSLLTDDFPKTDKENNLEGEAVKFYVDNQLSVFNKLISQNSLSDIADHYCAYSLGIKKCCELYVMLANSALKKGFMDNEIIKEIRDTEDKTDLNLFRMQQIITNFAKDCVKKETDTLNKSKEFVVALERLIDTQIEEGSFDLDEIRKMGAEYGYYPQEG